MKGPAPRFLVLGAGRMGQAVAWDLARQAGTAEVALADADPGALRRAKAFVRHPALRTVRADAARPASLLPHLKRADACASAVPYFLNLPLAKAAVAAKTHFCDLGGNDAVVRRELALDKAACRAGVTVVPDCGLAPGMVSLLVADGLSRFPRARAVRIRVGGLPLKPLPPMNYQLVFSVEGLINEYVEPCRVLRKGRIVPVPPMSELEALRFPAPFGKLEAFTTSGGASTLPDTLRRRVRDLDYKTIRYPGHAEQFRLLWGLGIPRKILAKCLSKALPEPGPDAVLIRVELDAGRRRLVYQCVDRQKGAFTAMMRTTAFPIAVIAGMLARGEIRTKGAVPQERSVPPRPFLGELARRGIRITRRWA